jgi:hypothetical protein
MVAKRELRDYYKVPKRSLATSLSGQRSLGTSHLGQEIEMEKTAKIYLAGHDGLVGSAIKRRLEQAGYQQIITRSFKELDLRRQEATEDFFTRERFDYVFLAAAKVGGIVANTIRGIRDNLMIEANIIHRPTARGQKLLFPVRVSLHQPMTEDVLARYSRAHQRTMRHCQNCLKCAGATGNRL